MAKFKLDRNKRMRSVIDWLEHRTGVESAVKQFLYEDIPASSGWHQVFGSMALFAFLVQVFTGILLACNYAPTPGDAYTSVQYIMTQLTAGPLIRGLHHWGATMMIIIVVVHMAQVFLYGAYKKPREATWILGVILLLLTMAFGLTGYLLPWDNRAYWSTVVTTQIMGSVPVLGPYVQRLAGVTGNSIGVVTFARFFSVHVLLLPPIFMLLIAVHVYLVRKHGVAPEAGDTAPHKKFFPEQVFKDTVAIFIAFVILVVLAVVARTPLERMADPTITATNPRPEWYFLFLFEILKFMQGPLEVVGTVVLPGLATLALFLVPFIDRGPALRLGKRTFAAAVLALSAVAWTGLTAAAWITTPKDTEVASSTESSPQSWQRLPPAALAGLGLFRAQGCMDCHAGPGAKGIGPDLTRVAQDHRSVAWLVPHFKDPAKLVPGSQMPPVKLPDNQLNELAQFILQLNPDDYSTLMSAPDFATAGATVYEMDNCESCHQLNGTGTQVGPPLNGVSARHDRMWLEKHFRDPQSTSPGSFMPAYKFSASDMDNICKYLLAIPQ